MLSPGAGIHWRVRAPGRAGGRPPSQEMPGVLTDLPGLIGWQVPGYQIQSDLARAGGGDLDDARRVTGAAQNGQQDLKRVGVDCCLRVRCVTGGQGPGDEHGEHAGFGPGEPHVGEGFSQGFPGRAVGRRERGGEFGRDLFTLPAGGARGRVTCLPPAHRVIGHGLGGGAVTQDPQPVRRVMDGPGGRQPGELAVQPAADDLLLQLAQAAPEVGVERSFGPLHDDAQFGQRHLGRAAALPEQGHARGDPLLPVRCLDRVSHRLLSSRWWPRGGAPARPSAVAPPVCARG